MSLFKITGTVSESELNSTAGRGKTRDEGFASLVETLKGLFESGNTDFQRINTVEQANRTPSSFFNSLKSEAHAMGMNVSRTTRDPEWSDADGDNPSLLVRYNPNPPSKRSSNSSESSEETVEDEPVEPAPAKSPAKAKRSRKKATS